VGEHLLPLREKVAAQRADEGEVCGFALVTNLRAPPLPVGSADHPLPRGERVRSTPRILAR
jgi:hypothetical protein